MLFRRISQHLREQNWFAVALDFMIVVVGVFLGFQLESWNEARKERVEELEYLTRLYDDMSESIDGTQPNIDFMISHANKATVVLSSLSACNIAPDEGQDFATGLFQLGKVVPAQLVSTAIDELRSTGKLHILRNVELRSRIQEMQARYQGAISIFSQIEGRLLPHINYVDSVVSFDIDGPISGNSEMPLDKLRMDFQSLCADRHFFNAVASVRNYVFDLANQNRGQVRRFQSVREALSAELGK